MPLGWLIFFQYHGITGCLFRNKRLLVQPLGETKILLTKFLVVLAVSFACSIANIPCRGSLFQIPLDISDQKKLA